MGDSLARELEAAWIEHDRKFIEILKKYQGEEGAFQLIITAALSHDLFQKDLAEICLVSDGAITRWIRGARATKLVRVAAVERIRIHLEKRLADPSQRSGKYKGSLKALG